MEKTLLLVDDEQNVTNALTRVFQGEGYRLLACNSAREALEILSKQEVQVILTDQRMPEMSGVELLSRVRGLYPDTIRMVLSGYADVEAVTAAINEGHVYKFLFKPWDNDLLRQNVREAFVRFDRMQQGRQFSRIFENSAEGILITDRNTLIQSVNPTFSALTGYAADEAIGKTPALLKSDRHDARFFERMWNELNQHGKWSGEIWNRRKDGQDFLAWMTITSVRDATGQVRQYIGLFSDITELRQREEEEAYRQAYENALNDTFEARENADSSASWLEAARDE